jgi:glycosyltransferase involved in cell wall biosynthesis
MNQLASGNDTRANHGSKSTGLRVAIIASSYNYIRDGVALTLNRLVAYLERQGVEVLVFAPVGKTPALEHVGTLIPIPSIPVPGRPEYRCAFPIPKATQEILRQFNPHIMHVALAPDPLGYSALKTAKALNIPVVASCHTRYETYLKHYRSSWLEGLLKSYLKYAYGQVREVYVPSQSMLNALLADGMRDNFKLWPRGVDTDAFSPTKRDSKFRERNGIRKDDFVVSFVSRLVREKELDTVIATLKTLEAQGITHKALIVGDGPDRGMLEAALPNAVFTGFLKGEALAEAYAASDVFLFPSETETFGNVTLEAMASGLPCVCADATGSSSLVVDHETGYLVRPRNVEEFALRIAELAKDSDLHQRMSIAARQRSLKFSWDDCMARILGYYQGVVAEAQP